MDKLYRIYLCEFDWYDEYDDTERHEYLAMMAGSTAEAVESIEHRFPYSDNLVIHKHDDSRFIFLNKTLFNRLLNTEDGLAYEEDATEEEDVGATPESVNDCYSSCSNNSEIPVTDEEDACWNEMGHALERCAYY